MKKIKLVLVLAACLFGLTACGEKKAVDEAVKLDLVDRSMSMIYGGFSDGTINNEINACGDARKAAEMFEEQADNVEGVAVVAAADSYNRAVAEIGDFVSIDGFDLAEIQMLAMTGDYETAEKMLNEFLANIPVEYDTAGEKIIVSVPCKFENKSATMEFIYKDDYSHTFTSSATNIDYTFGEKMAKAGLNTLLGMGTVFAVLILIFGIISLFNFIPKIEAALKKKDAQPAATSVDNAITQIVESEELSDDLELVAVISAAIAAYEGSASTDGYVVRSIRRVDNGSKWQRAL